MVARLTVLSLILGSGIFAAETVCLKTGFCLQAISHAEKGQMTILKIGGGEIELATQDIASIEVSEVSPVGVQPAGSKTADVPAPVAGRDSEALLLDAATQTGMDAVFVRSVAKVESDFRQEAVSAKGAMGLMQLTGASAKDLGVNPRVASENALGGAKYLRALLLRYHSNSALALAAYNAGPGAVAKYGGVPPFSETRSYIGKVTREYDRSRAAAASRQRVRGPAVKGAVAQVAARD